MHDKIEAWKAGRLAAPTETGFSRNAGDEEEVQHLRK